MPAADGKLGIFARFQRHGILYLCDGWRGTDAAAEHNRHTIRNSTQDAAAMVRFGNDLTSLHAPGIIGLAAAQRSKPETLAERNALYRGHGEQQMAQHALHAVKERSAQTHRQSGNHALDHAADRIAIRLRAEDFGLHLLFQPLPEHRQRHAAESFSVRNRRIQQAFVMNVRQLLHMTHDIDALIAHPLPAQRPCEHDGRRQPA